MESSERTQAYDVALMHSAWRFNLATQEGRSQSARWLSHLYLRLIVEGLRPAVTLELGAKAAGFSIDVKTALPEASVHALEANPYTYAAFARRLHKYGINYRNLAVGDTSGPAVFKVQRKKMGVEQSPTRGSNSLRTKPGDFEYEDATVDQLTVDDYVARAGIVGLPTAMWVDVEGCAFEALSGASRTLKQTEALLVEVEDRPIWNGQKLSSNVMGLLLEADFIPVARDFEFPGQHNVLFLSPDAYARSCGLLESLLSQSSAA
jgi:FkbM family methyltransferase